VACSLASCLFTQSFISFIHFETCPYELERLESHLRKLMWFISLHSQKPTIDVVLLSRENLFIHYILIKCTDINVECKLRKHYSDEVFQVCMIIKPSRNMSWTRHVSYQANAKHVRNFGTKISTEDITWDTYARIILK
jgi:hypothetical protein